MVLSALVASLILAPSVRWVYLATNFYVDDNVEKALSLLKRAKDSGYTGFLVADSKFLRWDSLEPRYAKNARQFRDAVKAAGLEFIACVTPIGYSNDLLSRDPNLAEGLPVLDQVFVVKPDGTLVPEPEGGQLQNGSFEEGEGNTPKGWSWVDAPGKVSFLDREEHKDGATSLRMTDIGQNGNGRANQKLAVKPFHNYHVSFWVKTKDFDTPGNTNITILSPKGQSLQQTSLPLKKDMDWTKVDVTFNSLDNSEVLFYAGVWGGNKGTIWWDDFRIEPAGLVNLVRRPSAPFKVTSQDKQVTYKEGQDLERAVDPKMGNIAWPGDYNVWHEQPVWKTVAGSKLQPGSKVLASYFHTALIYDGQVGCCLGDPRVFEIVKWQIEQVKSHLQPDGYMLSHDEIRVGGWDPGCTQFGDTPGEALAKNVRRCAEIVRSVDPKKTLYTWSDMFDPWHNARDKGYYYLVKGEAPWKESWMGLDKDLVVVNWNMQEGDRQKSLAFFKDRGHRQILAGYYDGGGVSMETWTKEAGNPLGVMYTTWQSKFDDLESFATLWKR